MILLQILLICLSGRLSLTKPDGAPPLSCKHMLPGHTTFNYGKNVELIVNQPEATSRYIINATWDVEQRKYVRVSITGSQLRGFLIQARRTVDGDPLGNFKILSNDSKYQNCIHEKYNPEASVTHTDPTPKDNVTFLWAPPSEVKAGNITFYVTIAKTKEEYWLQLPSNSIYLSESNRGSSSSLLSNVVFLVLTLFIRMLWI